MSKNEPVVWGKYYPEQDMWALASEKTPPLPSEGFIPLYTHLAKTLTDEEIEKVFYDTHFGFKGRDDSDFMDFARAILRKAQEK